MSVIDILSVRKATSWSAERIQVPDPDSLCGENTVVIVRRPHAIAPAPTICNLAPCAEKLILGFMSTGIPTIPRHKTAIRRGDLSRPVKSALHDGLIVPTSTVFDYGCGHGQDIAFLGGQGIACDGWDPAFRPDSPKKSADVVNLGYVLNVIEDVAERAAALWQAWALAQRLLVVAALVKEEGQRRSQSPFGDGVLTGRGTFQKFFGQGELKAFLESELQVEAIPASLGVFYVFKDETLQQQFLANRFRRRAAAPRKRISELRFEEHRELLESFMATISDLGRLPEEDEFPRSAEVMEAFGSLKRGFALVRRVTGGAEWEAIHRRRTEDLLVYLALARFRRRPPLRCQTKIEMSPLLQNRSVPMIRSLKGGHHGATSDEHEGAEAFGGL